MLPVVATGRVSSVKTALLQMIVTHFVGMQRRSCRTLETIMYVFLLAIVPVFILNHDRDRGIRSLYQILVALNR